MGHTISRVRRSEFDHTFRCQCGHTPPSGFRTEQMAEDAAAQHLDQVQRLRLKVTAHRESLEAAYDHYQKMAADPHVDDTARVEWEQLAAQVGTRLGHNAPPSEQGELFPL